jgi:hypothetical protein
MCITRLRTATVLAVTGSLKDPLERQFPRQNRVLNMPEPQTLLILAIIEQ